MKLNDLPEHLFILESETYAKDNEESILDGTGFSFHYELVGGDCCSVFAWPSREALDQWRTQRNYPGSGHRVDRTMLVELLKVESKVKSIIFNPGAEETEFAPERVIRLSSSTES